MSNAKRLAPAIFAIAVAACARTAPIDPHAQSAGSHEVEQASHEREAARHDREQAREAPKPERACRPHLTGSICWTELRKSGRHEDEARTHRSFAREHGRAARVLTAAETRACRGLSSPDRDVSPFRHTADILRTERVEGGAVVVFRAVPGLSAENLQSIVDCHLAQNAARGHDVAEMPYCPLVPRGVTAEVAAAAGGFAVRITAADPETAREIRRRVERLTHPVEQRAAAAGSGPAAICPMAVDGSRVRAEDVELGAALVFTTTTPGAVAELRQRVSRLARVHNRAHRGALGARPATPPSTAQAEIIEEGIRLVLTPLEPAQLDELRARVRQDVVRWASGECPMRWPGGE